MFYFKTKLTNILLVLSVIIFLFGTGYRLGESRALSTKVERGNYSIFDASRGTAPVNSNNKKGIDFELFWEVWDSLEQKFVDKNKLDSQKMFYGAIKGMVASLEDPYTFFLTPDENRLAKDDLGGKFEGIGAQLGLDNNKIIIVAPLKNSPAKTAGIKAGDHILKVNGQSTKDWTIFKAVSEIRGPKGTKVKLDIQRNGEELNFEIERKEIHVDSVELSYEAKTGCTSNCQKVAYIKINQFGDSTTEEWDRATHEVKEKWDVKQIKGLILDFRDNPGGYLDAAIYLTSEFLAPGKLVTKQESSIQKPKEYLVTRNGKLLDIPLTIIVNRGSASAAEIVSGSLRDYGRAKLIGEKSFGKGSVQEAVDLKNKAGLHVTIAKWILPKGDWINGKGINPQIEVKNTVSEGNTLTRKNDMQLDRAIEEILK